MTIPFMNTELAQRLIAAERDCYVDWVRAMQAQPDNPFGIAIQTFGQATAIVCSRVPAEIWNRVFNFTPDDLALLPEIIAFYQQHNAQILLDLNPYTTPPFWEEPHMTVVLARQYGMFQAAFHQMLYGVPTQDVPPTPEHIVIKEVGAAEISDFERTYETVWGNGNEISVLVGQPNFRNYLAYIEDQPVALGVVHIKNGMASMANALTAPAMRGKGCQTALLYHRIKQAAIENCELLVSQCRPGSTSQNNQLRAGFHVAGTKAWWLLQSNVTV
ncbi:MAG: hypothetical protein H0X30_28250 [Anaerolineae bacterium]|nr:hypothetical protein [Anaerolineae bacterium]